MSIRMNLPPTLTIVIRGPKTDQEHTGVTRTLRANPTDICPVYATIKYLGVLATSDPDRKLPPPPFAIALLCA